MTGCRVDVWVGGGPAGRSHAVARRALALSTGLPADDVRLERDSRGGLVACGLDHLRVSVSHTTGVLLVAVAACRRLGVDVEPLRKQGLRSLPRHALAPAEFAELERHDPARRTEAFVRYWTRKEALLKAAGTGLAVDPRLVELPPWGGSPHPTTLPATLGRAGGWWVAGLDLDGYAAAVAVDAPHPRVRLRLLPAPDRDQPAPGARRSTVTSAL